MATEDLCCINTQPLLLKKDELTANLSTALVDNTCFDPAATHPVCQHESSRPGTNNKYINIGGWLCHDVVEANGNLL